MPEGSLLGGSTPAFHCYRCDLLGLALDVGLGAARNLLLFFLGTLAELEVRHRDVSLLINFLLLELDQSARNCDHLALFSRWDIL